MLSMAPLLAHPLWSGHFNGCYCHSILLFSSSFSPAPAAAISWSKAKFTRPSSINIYSVPKIKAIIRGNSDTEVEAEEQDFKIVTAVRSNYNDIMIVDTTESRMLLLDSTHNVHSIFYTGQKWTGSYWDEFASIPAIVPKGPIAILGLGGGTAAHLMLDLWPSLRLEGWEIDEILIDKAREYLGLSNLETGTQAGGVLKVHVGDALSPSNVSGGFSGIIVDLFSDGKVLPQLEEVVTWMGLKEKLIPHGRILVNCGGTHAEASNITDGIMDPKVLSDDAVWLQNSTIKALYKAFPGQLSWKRMANGDGENYLALTGPLPDLNAWSAAVPGHLSLSVKHWRPCDS